MREWKYIIMGLMMTGCQSFERGIGEVGAVGGGAAIGKAATKSSWGPIAGGAGGLAVAKIVEGQVDKKMEDKYKEGYKEGMVQVSKQCYLASQNIQRTGMQDRRTGRLVEIEIPEQSINGEIIKGRKELIRVE